MIKKKQPSFKNYYNLFLSDADCKVVIIKIKEVGHLLLRTKLSINH